MPDWRALGKWVGQGAVAVDWWISEVWTGGKKMNLHLELVWGHSMSRPQYTQTHLVQLSKNRICFPPKPEATTLLYLPIHGQSEDFCFHFSLIRLPVIFLFHEACFSQL